MESHRIDKNFVKNPSGAITFITWTQAHAQHMHMLFRVMATFSLIARMCVCGSCVCVVTVTARAAHFRQRPAPMLLHTFSQRCVGRATVSNLDSSEASLRTSA